jgi:hypothetical protein
MGYESIYEEEIILWFDDGILKNTENYQNQIIKKSDFGNSITDFIYSNIDWDRLPDFNGSYYHTCITIQPTEEGMLDSIVTAYTYLTITKEKGFEVINDMDNVFIKEGIRIVKLIPDRDVIYKRGKIQYDGIIILFCDEQKNKYNY